MSIRFGKRAGLIAAACAIGAPIMWSTLPAQASQLSDTTNSIGCNEVSISAAQKVQYCGVVNLDGTDVRNQISAIADVTAYKKNKAGQWVTDPSVLVSVDSATLYLDGKAVAGGAYPSGPQAGYANGMTRGSTEISRTTSHRAYVKASFGIWKTSAGETKSFKDQQGPTAIIPAGDGVPGGGLTHANPYGSLACTAVAIDSTHGLRNCVDGGLSATADVTAFKKVNGEWVQDNATSVSVDTVADYVDGASSGGNAYPSGPQPGSTTGGTRGMAFVDPSVSHTTYATAKIGLWKNGVETKTFSITSNLGTIPPQQ